MKISYSQLKLHSLKLAEIIQKSGQRYGSVFGIPSGGLVPACIIAEALQIPLIEEPVENTLIVDDIKDSGKTLSKYPNNDHAVLFWKEHGNTTAPTFYASIVPTNTWIELPHEAIEGKRGVEDNIIRLLEYIGEDVHREGLEKTPHRVQKMWKEVTIGYTQSAEELFASVFTSDNGNMVIVKDIEFYSHCEHHMVPFFGKVHIGYVPNGKVLGLSKFARLVDIFAKRLQIQEQLTEQIAEEIKTHLQPLGVIVVIEAKHMCMMMRGIQKQCSSTTTSALRGIFKTDQNARSEFLSLINKQ